MAAPSYLNIPRYLLGKRVRAHWNLHKHAYSVAVKHAGRWKVDCLVPYLYLTSVKFVVSAKGRERGIRLGKEVVHAWVEGMVISASEFSSTLGDRVSIAYNPKRAGTFMAFPGQEVPWVGGGGASLDALPEGGVIGMSSVRASVSSPTTVRRPVMTGIWVNPYKASKDIWDNADRLEAALRGAPVVEVSSSEEAISIATFNQPIPPRPKPLPPPWEPSHVRPVAGRLDAVRSRLRQQRVQREVAGMPGPYSH